MILKALDETIVSRHERRSTAEGKRRTAPTRAEGLRQVKPHTTAARLFAEVSSRPTRSSATTVRPGIATTPPVPLRSAASGQGKDDPKPDDAARAKLRKQALDWLKAELSAWRRVSMIIAPGNRELVAQALSHWKQDADLAGIRDEVELANLQDEERAAFKQLWTDVDGLRTSCHSRGDVRATLSLRARTEIEPAAGCVESWPSQPLATASARRRNPFHNFL